MGKMDAVVTPLSIVHYHSTLNVITLKVIISFDIVNCYSTFMTVKRHMCVVVYVVSYRFQD